MDQRVFCKPRNDSMYLRHDDAQIRLGQIGTDLPPPSAQYLSYTECCIFPKYDSINMALIPLEVGDRILHKRTHLVNGDVLFFGLQNDNGLELRGLQHNIFPLRLLNLVVKVDGTVNEIGLFCNSSDSLSLNMAAPISR